MGARPTLAMGNPGTQRRRHHWLLLLPFAWQVGLTPWANGVQWRPLALPFLMVWEMAGIVLTTLVIAGVFALDRRADRLSRPTTQMEPPTGAESSIPPHRPPTGPW